MPELIRCTECEGWGVTAYEKYDTPIKCERCDGTGKVEKPPVPVYIPYDVTATSWWATSHFGQVVAEAKAGVPCCEIFSLDPAADPCSMDNLCHGCKMILALCDAVAEAYNEGFQEGRE